MARRLIFSSIVATLCAAAAIGSCGPSEVQPAGPAPRRVPQPAGEPTSVAEPGKDEPSIETPGTGRVSGLPIDQADTSVSLKEDAFASHHAAVGVMQLRSDVLLEGLTSSCLGVLVAPDVVLLSARCFDWHRSLGSGNAPTGQQRFTLPSGETADVAWVLVHPAYRFVACDDRFGMKTLLLCGLAQLECAARRRVELSQCILHAATRVKEWQGGASHDLAVAYLRQALTAPPMNLFAADAPPESLEVLNLPQGKNGAAADHWYPTTARVRGLQDDDWLVESTGPDAYASLAFVPGEQTSAAWRLAALGSRPLRWTGAPAHTSLLFTAVDVPWVEQMLGARAPIKRP